MKTSIFKKPKGKWTDLRPLFSRVFETTALVSMISIFLLAVSCEKTPEPASESELIQILDIKGADDELATKNLMKGEERFAFTLLAKITDKRKNENVFLSPFGISQALSFVFGGSTGETRREIAQVLGLDGNSRDMADAVYALIANRLSHPRRFHFETERSSEKDVHRDFVVENRLWIGRSCRFQKDFLFRGLRYYGASPMDLNQNVRERQREVYDVRENPDPDAVRIENEVRFAWTWSEKFNKSLTVEEDFHLLDGNVKKHPMMRMKKSLRYAEDSMFQAVALPYGALPNSINGLNMYVFLPRKNMSLKTLIERFAAESPFAGDVFFIEDEGKVVLPKFMAKSKLTLKDSLSAMGIKRAFDRKHAEFPNLGDCQGQGVYIDEIYHNGTIEVVEDGTRAYASTLVIISTMGIEKAGPEYSGFEMIVDRPFLIVIRDDDSGAILFFGAIFNPEKVEAGSVDL